MWNLDCTAGTCEKCIAMLEASLIPHLQIDRPELFACDLEVGKSGEPSPKLICTLCQPTIAIHYLTYFTAPLPPHCSPDHENFKIYLA